MKKRYLGVVLLVIALLTSFLVYSLDDFQRSTMVFDQKSPGTQIFFVSTTGIAITEVWFDNSIQIEKANMIVESSKQIAGLPLIENAYEYETIGKLGINEEDISNFKVKFRIKTEWIQNNSQNNTIKLYYYSDKWISTNSTYIFSDAVYSYYEAIPQKLTYLAVGGDKKIIEPITLPEKKNTQEIKEQISEIVSTPVTATKNYLSNKNIIIYSLLLSAILITIIIIYYFFNMISEGSYFENLKEAEEFIDEELSEGISKKQIEKDLEEKGWPKKVVEKIVHRHHLSPEMEIKIKSTIQNMRNNMMKDHEIKTALTKQGWASDLIDEVFEEFTS